jgi:hypothetical protein
MKDGGEHMTRITFSTTADWVVGALLFAVTIAGWASVVV